MKSIEIESNRNHTIVTILPELIGFKFIFGWAGNCISRCLHFHNILRLKDGEKTIIQVTFRWNMLSNETDFFLYLTPGKLPRLKFHSKYLARRFGRAEDAPHGTIYIWESKIFGTHADI